jgi:hypothetical protein
MKKKKKRDREREGRKKKKNLKYPPNPRNTNYFFPSKHTKEGMSAPSSKLRSKLSNATLEILFF